MGDLRKLSDDEIREKLAEIPGWELSNGKLHRVLKFDDFSAAFGFMAVMATVSEAHDHHPEWFNVYSRLVIDLATHDVDGVSVKDFQWAAEANRRLS